MEWIRSYENGNDYFDLFMTNFKKRTACLSKGSEIAGILFFIYMKSIPCHPGNSGKGNMIYKEVPKSCHL